MLKQRVTTAIIVILLVLSAVYFLPIVWIAGILMFLSFLGGWEWAEMSGFTSKLGKIVFVVLFIDLVAVLLFLDLIQVYIVAAGLFWWIFAVFLTLTYTHKGVSQYGRFQRSLMGFLTLVPAILSMYLIVQMSTGRSLLIYLLILIWIADSGAYFAGKRFGKNKLCPQVSPGKTWEGVLGAMLACILFSMFYGRVSDLQATEIMVFLALSMITVVLSIFGDLLVSLVKREAHMKDSGNLLPGHGGIMDRIDSLTAAAPVFFIGTGLMEGVT